MQLLLSTELTVPLRAEARHASELVSQLLLFEPAEVLDSTVPDWLRVRSQHDGYEGWAPAAMLAPLPEEHNWSQPQGYGVCTQMQGRLGRSHTRHSMAGPMQVPPGCMLPAMVAQAGALVLGPHRYTWPAELFEKPLTGPLYTTALHLLHAPYLWGGRTPWGIDCSGLMQIVHRLHGIALPRDAWQQQQACQPIGWHSRQPDHMAFFANDAGRITHVGMLMEEDYIIHASHRVRVDRLTDTGILSLDTGQQTHSLHSLGTVR